LRKSIVVVAALAALAFASSGEAANWKVSAGEQARAPAGVPKSATLNKFMPKRLVINAGDKVAFSSASFHTVTYLHGQKPPPFFLPDPAKANYTDILDQAGNPFYFDGMLKSIYNVAAFSPIGGNKITGTAPVSSGALSPGGPKQQFAVATYQFPKTGTFKLVCNVHPKMDISVVVKPAASPAPLTPAQVTAASLAEQASSWATAKKLADTKPPAGTVFAGIGGTVELIAFLPKSITVKSGATVRFLNKSPSDIHNVAFGPQKYLDSFQMKTDLFPMGPKAPNQTSPVFPYGTEPKGGYTYDGSNHGNGFLVTPLTGGTPKFGLPLSASVTFTNPGTYKFICMIHGEDMSGRVIVTP
jgi:plastocyanin